MTEIRTRIAPSPTGSPHVGNLYMGLFSQAFARRHGGKFILRIEDTDKTRSRPEYEAQLLEAFRWAGLDWDEGPGVGGPHAPYRQSERSEIYTRHAAELIEKGQAYYAFDTAEELAAIRAEAVAEKRKNLGYDGRHRELSKEEIEKRLAEGQPHVIRLKVPREGTVTVKDLLKGNVTVECEGIDDQILIKSDGFPTYHLACMVDDHLMGVTHVIRGEEWLNSAPKHVLIYQAFGWEPPVWVHMPLLKNPDGTKLSKRKNPTSVSYYREAGFLPEALANYLCQMGYSQKDGAEKFTAEAFAAGLELERVAPGGSVFDVQKLLHLNAQYLRDLSEDEVFAAMKAWRYSDEYLRSLLPMMHERMETLGDFIPKTHAFFRREVAVSPEVLAVKNLEPEMAPEILQTLNWALDEHLEWDAAVAEVAIKKVAAFWDLKLRLITGLGFRALFGEPVGPPLYESMERMGRDMTRDRLRRAQVVAGDVSKKKAKKLEKRWTAFKPEASAEG